MISKISVNCAQNQHPTSEPTVIANLILKAIEAKKPRTRYAGGKLAKPLLCIRKWGGDRFFDWILGAMIG